MIRYWCAPPPQARPVTKARQVALVIKAQKEEGVETALAAVAESEDKLTSEAADLVYHLLVLLAAKDVKFESVIAELKSRHK